MKRRVIALVLLVLNILSIFPSLTNNISLANSHELPEIPGKVITHKFTFNESSIKHREESRIIPGLRGVKDIRVNNGKVNYEISGNQLTIKAFDGDVVNTKRVTEQVSEIIRRDTDAEFPSSIPYNKNGFTGNLKPTGSSRPYVKEGSPAGTINVEEKVDWYWRWYFKYSDSELHIYENYWRHSHYEKVPNPETLPPKIDYDKNGYKGTLTNTGIDVWVYDHTYPFPSNPSLEQSHLRHLIAYQRIYKGDVTKPDTRVYGREKTYTGIVEGESIKTYAYEVEVDVIIADTKIITHHFNKTTSRNRTATIDIPHMSEIINVSVNTGNVNYSIDKENQKITLNVSNGEHVDIFRHSKIGYDSITQRNTSFPGSINYNDGYYSGSISKSGGYSSKVISGSPADQKEQRWQGQFYRVYYSKYSEKSKSWVEQSWKSTGGVSYGNRFASWEWSSYNNDGYSGTMYSDYDYGGGELSPILYSVNLSLPSNPSDGDIAPSRHEYRRMSYKGTISKPDTRVWEYTQNYSGTVYGPWIYEYEYTVTIEYVDDAPRPPGPFINPTYKNVERGGPFTAIWIPTSKWGYGRIDSRTYEIQFFDSMKWSESFFVEKGANPPSEKDFILPYSLNTNKAKFRVRSVSSLGTSIWIYSDEFIIDNIAPEVTEKRVYDGDIVSGIILNYTDNLSGVKTREYAWSQGLPEEDQWKSYIEGEEVNPEEWGDWYLYYRSEDNAGNVGIGYFGPYSYYTPNEIEGMVNHTPSWNSHRIKYNLSKGGTEDYPRPYHYFFPGERFILKAIAIHGKPNKVEVHIEGYPYTTDLTLNSMNVWEGSLWHKDMLNWDSRDLNFIFKAYFPRGKVEVYEVPVRVEDDKYWRLKQKF